jgi:hypothetical protein
MAKFALVWLLQSQANEMRALIKRYETDGCDKKTIQKAKKQLAEIEIEIVRVEAGLPPPKPDKRKLSKDDIAHRRRIVAKAVKMRKRHPAMTWKAIADHKEIDVSERTLRDWRHNPTYQ